METITEKILKNIEAELPKEDSRLYNDAGKALIWRLRNAIEEIRNQERREYLISITGEQSHYEIRMLRKYEAEMLEDIIPELDDGPECCRMEVLPTETEFAQLVEICKDVDNCKYSTVVREKYPEMSWAFVDYVRGRVETIIMNSKNK